MEPVAHIRGRTVVGSCFSVSLMCPSEIPNLGLKQHLDMVS